MSETSHSWCRSSFFQPASPVWERKILENFGVASSAVSCVNCTRRCRIQKNISLRPQNRSTMVKTQRSSHGGGEFSPDTAKRQKNACGVTMAPSSWSIELQSDHQGALWCHVMPLQTFDNARDNIQKATGVPWEHLLPLLSDTGLVCSGATSAVMKTHVCAARWQEVASALQRHARMQVTSIRRRVSPKECFFFVEGM